MIRSADVRNLTLFHLYYCVILYSLSVQLFVQEEEEPVDESKEAQKKEEETLATEVTLCIPTGLADLVWDALDDVYEDVVDERASEMALDVTIKHEEYEQDSGTDVDNCDEDNMPEEDHHVFLCVPKYKVRSRLSIGTEKHLNGLNYCRIY